jgi:hypothetical protein
LRTVTIKTLAGPMKLTTASSMNLIGVPMKRILLSEAEISIAGVECSGILGMDWLRGAGTFTVSFTNGKPRITFESLTATNFIGILETVTEEEPSGLECSKIEKDDFTLQRTLQNDGKFRWTVKWKWVDGKQPERKILPPSYGMNTLNEEEWTLVNKELDEWKEKYVEPIEWAEVGATAPLVPRRQLHKSTPIRMVHDLTWLNKHIVTVPNPEKPPSGAQEYIRKWRAKPECEIFMVDIRKAYLNIEVLPECSKWQCMRFPGDNRVYRLNRLGFGLNISPKVLKTILESILPSDVHIGKFVDDLYVPKHLLEEVRAILNQNNFPTKEPELLTDTRVLGLQNSSGRWGRKDALPTGIDPFTKRGISSYTGKILGIYPIAKWLRPACSYIKRRCEADWDIPLDTKLVEICKKFVEDVNRRGKVIGGEWFYNPHEQWRVWTDASDVARGCVLQIGEVCVEDTAHLRKKGDKKHINVAELQAIQDGVELATDYIKALNWKDEVKLKVMCDNATAISWLKQSKERKWKAIKGLSAKLVERILIQIAELCRMYNIKIDIEYIPSESNLADELSRVPPYMIEQVDFDPTTIEDVVMAAGANQPLPDKYGRLIVDETRLLELLKGVHEHEGAKALYDRCRLIIYHPKLRQRCLEYVRDCAICQIAKHNTELPPVLKNDNHVHLEADRPFQCMHMDVLGPYIDEDGFDRMFVVTLVCRLTRFAITVPTFQCPRAEDAAKIFGSVYARFHTSPDTVVVDEGCQFKRLFSTLIEQYNTRIISTAVKASFSNGRIERIHRTINERIRAKEISGGALANMNQFSAIVERATALHNTQLHSVTGSTPHEMVFTFQQGAARRDVAVGLYPKLKEYRTVEKTDYDPINPREELEKAQQPEAHPLKGRRLPDEGEVWLWKLPIRRKKDPPFIPCKIIAKLSTQNYRIRLRTGRTKQVHIRHLKGLSKEAVENIPDELKIPEDLRPMRNLKPSRGGGGM